MAAFAIGLFITACSTINNPETLAGELESATFLGTSFHLRDNPQDKPRFEEARAYLAQLRGTVGTTPTNIVQIIQRLPLKGDALLYREGALLVLRRVSLPGVPVDADGMRLLIDAADRGIERGLATVAAAEKNKAKAKKSVK